jgi:hypothetical protein
MKTAMRNTSKAAVIAAVLAASAGVLFAQREGGTPKAAA